jgi:hypothetical protein
VVRRHPDIHHHQVRPMLAHKSDQLRRIAALPNNLKARALKQARETLAEENIIIRERNPSRVCGHVRIIDRRPTAGRL